MIIKYSGARCPMNVELYEPAAAGRDPPPGRRIAGFSLPVA